MFYCPRLLGVALILFYSFSSLLWPVRDFLKSFVLLFLAELECERYLIKSFFCYALVGVLASFEWSCPIAALLVEMIFIFKPNFLRSEGCPVMGDLSPVEFFFTFMLLYLMALLLVVFCLNRVRFDESSPYLIFNVEKGVLPDSWFSGFDIELEEWRFFWIWLYFAIFALGLSSSCGPEWLYLLRLVVSYLFISELFFIIWKADVLWRLIDFFLSYLF